MIDHTYSFGETPPEVLAAQIKAECPDGYPMTIRCKTEWAMIAGIVNQGIDSHLEALTERSTFDASTGEILIHPEELPCFLRRLAESDDTDEAWSLRLGILGTLGIEEV